MRRRDFITLIGGAAAWPLAARAQQPERMRRIGVLTNGAQDTPQSGQDNAAALRKGLQEHGWIDGRNIRIEFHSINGEKGREQAAKDLVGAQPDVIVCSTSPSTAAVSQLTRSIPIVFVNVTEPAAQGFVSSDARPGGNVTGFSNFEPSMAGKWLEIIKGIDPRIQRVAILFNPETAPNHGNFFLPSFQAASTALGIQPIEASLHDPAEIEPAVNALVGEAHAGLIMMPDAFTGRYKDQIIGSATAHRIPVISAYRAYTEAGGLVSYGIRVSDLFYRAASYVDRILKGEKPADLPVQAPTNFELAINLKTAKLLGLTMPALVQQLADEVIE
jgi:putative ABC transport system substrate-binding protein